MKFFSQLHHFMMAGARAHAKWEMDISNTILRDRRRLAILGLLLIPILIGGIAFAEEVVGSLPGMIGGKTAYAPAFYTPTIFFASIGVGIVAGLITGCIGAGGGFIMNPLFVSIWPLPHTVVAGTVMPTVLFSQGSGIYNYSKIKFINWKLGVTIGLSMVIGGFIGPKLTELITLDQFKFVFGWILIVLAGLMFWQTTPGYIDKNKKEQAILKEFKQKAEAAARQKGN